MSIKKIGVLTGGGDCPGLNAVIRAVVKAALQKHGWQVVGFMDGYRGLVEGWTVTLSDHHIAGILVRGGTILGTNNRANPFAYTYGSGGGNVPAVDLSRKALLNIKKSELDALVIIGGDGTLASAQSFHELGIPVVGIPKTIDNDLNATDVTFGFDSALNVATEAVDRLHSTADAHHRIMLVEMMGRYAGWLTLRSGIAGGADVILIPEIPYDTDCVVQAIHKRTARGKEFTIIVVSEGAKSKSGEVVVQRRVEGSPDPIRLGGVSHKIADAIEDSTGMETRVTILGHVQRGGIPTPYDRWLATRYGVQAVELLSQGHFGRMVSLRGTCIESVPLKDAISNLRLVDPDGEEVQTARATGISFGN